MTSSPIKIEHLTVVSPQIPFFSLQKVKILTTPKIVTVKNHQVTCHRIQHPN